MELLWPGDPTALLIDRILGICLALFFASIAISCADVSWPWGREKD